MRGNLTRRAFGLAAAGVLSAAAAMAQPPAPAQNEIVIKNFAFSPARLTVPAGTRVVWVNEDGSPHTVVSAGEALSFKSPPLGAGEKFAFVFNQPGTYPYFCSVHPFMAGKIVVK